MAIIGGIPHFQTYPLSTPFILLPQWTLWQAVTCRDFMPVAHPDSGSARRWRSALKQLGVWGDLACWFFGYHRVNPKSAGFSSFSPKTKHLVPEIAVIIAPLTWEKPSKFEDVLMDSPPQTGRFLPRLWYRFSLDYALTSYSYHVGLSENVVYPIVPNG